MTRFLGLLLCSILCACTQQKELLRSSDKVGTEQTAQSRTLLVGRWYGDMQAADGGRRQWLTERAADGSFNVTFRVTSRGRNTYQREYGTWGISADIYFTVTSGFIESGLPEPADPTDPTLYDAYRVLSLSASGMTYQNLETGNTFVVRRVGDDFTIPEE